MIIQDIYLEDWDWTIKVFYVVDTCYIEVILAELENINCPEDTLLRVEKCLKEVNTGVTYSNLKYKCSIIVIGQSTSPIEFLNTWDHEKCHIANHISEEFNIEVNGEDFAYLFGDIGKSMFPIAKKFLCEHCKDELRRE